ncbi:MAG: AlwI family type II restriction endonuclease [Lachnospiraceae bacterium]|nr:AlwI family type II restriction endonuclease [Lachnospiraceae bacterium]
MAQKNRTKEIWLIPKRVNLHQTICLIDGILERNYDGTSWKPQKQDNLGVNLKKWGATKDGKNISQQAIRTLVASIPQYLGFVYINTDQNPNTICLTEAGKALWRKHRSELEKIPNLVAGKDKLITESEILLHQMEKLQITNPVINKDCQNIEVFPFRFLLKVLLETEYLDQEEIACILFRVQGEGDLDRVIQEIQRFREKSCEERKILMDAFRETHIGNITLVKASSAGYFISLCQLTGIVERCQITPDNRETSIAALKIKDEKIPYVKKMIYETYKGAETFDFKDQKQLWVDYMGNPERNRPPVFVTIRNWTKEDFLVQVCQGGCCKYDDLIKEKESLKFPMFLEEPYEVKVIELLSGNEWKSMEIIPTVEQREFDIQGERTEIPEKEETLEEMAEDILKHCGAAYFAEKRLERLKVLKKLTGIDKTKDKSLRGAYLEYDMYRLLTRLKEAHVIDQAVWNGKIGKYDLPLQAPGGKTGTPDLVVVIDDLHIVLELTTIRPKSLQFQAEGSSVPDHIRLYQKETGEKTIGVFCAPVIHERNQIIMESALHSSGIPFQSISVEDLLELFLTRDREQIKEKLSKHCKKLLI